VPTDCFFVLQPIHILNLVTSPDFLSNTFLLSFVSNYDVYNSFFLITCSKALQCVLCLLIYKLGRVRGDENVPLN